jgi:hypothetical protein
MLFFHREFNVEEAAIIWGSTYEEAFESSDSSHHTENSR